MATCHPAFDFDLLSLETVLTVVLYASEGQDDPVRKGKGVQLYSEGEWRGFLLTLEESDHVAAYYGYDIERMSADVAEGSRRMRQATVASQSRPWNGTEHLQLRYAKLGRVSGVPFINLVHENIVSDRLRTFGEWESLQTELLQGFLRPGDVAVDVGAHIGTHAVAFARVVGPSGTVYAFEAQPAVYEVLLDNAGIGGVGNMVVRNLAIGNTTAEGGKIAVRVLDLTTPDHHGLDDQSSNSSNFGGLSLLGCQTLDVDVSPSFDAEALVSECQGGQSDREHNHVWVDVVSLDSFGWHVGDGHKCPRVIKIDVEGMETQVLAGGRELLRTCRPILHVENNVPSGSSALIGMLREHEYDLHWEVSAFTGHSNYFGSPYGSLKDTGAAIPFSPNLLCLPKGFDVSDLSASTQSMLRSLTPVDPEKPLLKDNLDIRALQEDSRSVEVVRVIDPHGVQTEHWFRLPSLSFLAILARM
jgi:FkbM family methyltransferase